MIRFNALVGLALSGALLTTQNAGANGNGGGHKTGPCTPIRTNTFSPHFDPVPSIGLGSEFGKFESVALTPEQAKLGFLARRVSDSSFIVIPNRVNAQYVSWTQLYQVSGKKRELCATRIVVSFQSEGDAPEVSSLINVAKANDANARFVRPLLQNVQVEWTIPFVGSLARFDQGPTFPLGGVIAVWDLDAKNTRVLEQFIEKSGPSVDLPGVIMFHEMYTGLLFSISLSISGEELMKNRVAVDLQ